MKKAFLLILFLLPLMFFRNISPDLYLSTPFISYTDPVSVPKNTGNSTISSLIAANSFAEISIQQSVPSGTSLARRYRPAGFSFDKQFSYITEGRNSALVNSYKYISICLQEYIARQKSAGFYIYTLCKIII